MFLKIRRELHGIRTEIQHLTGAFLAASDALRDSQGSTVDQDRLAALEGRIEVVLGTVEAGLVKADALKATARAAEDRARGHLKRAEAYAELANGAEDGEGADPFEVAARAYEGAVPQADGNSSGEVYAVPGGVDSRRADLDAARSQKRQR